MNKACRLLHTRTNIVAALVLLALLLSSCAQASPTLIPTLAVTPSSGSIAQDAAPQTGGNGGTVMASAEVRPARVAEIGFAVAGVIHTVAVSEGQRVEAGDRLADLANIAELRAAVAAGQQNLASAQTGLETLTTQAPLALANAHLAVLQNQKRYDDALKHLKRPDVRRCSKDNFDLYIKRYDSAKENLDRAKDGNDGSLAALERVREAQNVFNIAQANYIYCLGYTEQEVSESNAELAVSEAALKQSREYYELLQAAGGLDPNEVARLNAAIANAEASLITTRAMLDRSLIVAPFAGVVIQVNALPSQAAAPGQAVFVLADLDNLQIETIDLSERDINRVMVGQAARVTVDALGQVLAGKVIKIDSRASKIGGDVVYKVTIMLDAPPKNLRWGMSARVEIIP